MNELKARRVQPATCLRVHSEFSEDGSATIRQLTERAHELGYTALALTDLSVMSGTFDLRREASRVGIKPIFGLDLPVWSVDPRSVVEDPEIHWDVITLLAENNIGLKHLFSLSSEAASLPAGTALTLPRLAASFSGLSAIVGGGDSHLSRLLGADNFSAGRYLDMLSDALGAQSLHVGIPAPDGPERETAKRLVQLADARSLKIVSGHTIRFRRPRDFETHQAYLRHKGSPTSPADAGAYMPEPDAIDQAFSALPEVFANSEEIVGRCGAEFPTGSNTIPRFPTESEETDSEMLRDLAQKGLKERYGDSIPAEATGRMEHELRVIEGLGCPSYFLIVWDLVRHAKEGGIVVGPGRGSSAGSIVCFLLGITELDPIEHGLLFERFLRPGRKVMPDIDIDVSVSGREPLILYLAEKYGPDSVAQISTRSRFGARAAIKAAATDCGFGADMGDRLAAIVPAPIMGRSALLAECLREGDPLLEAVHTDPDAAKVVSLARGLEGKVRYESAHAAAVVISEDGIEEHVPRQEVVSANPPGQPVRQSTTRLVTQFPMGQVEELGLLKLDILCLRSLDVIGEAVRLVARHRNVEVEIEDIPLDDAATFDLFARGVLAGVFFFESSEILEATRLVGPTTLDDLAALLALCRPGAKALIPAFAKGKARPDSIEYLDPRLEEITGSTYGCFVYQEQLMEISKKLAGFTPAESDDLRRAIGRKQRNLMAKMEQKFMDGTAASGTNHGVSTSLWASMRASGDYTFNKAHAASYALIAYRTAYLKANHSVEFEEAMRSDGHGS